MHNYKEYYINGVIAILIFLKISDYEYEQIGDFGTQSNLNMQGILQGLSMSEFTIKLAARCDTGQLWHDKPQEFFSDNYIYEPVFFKCLNKLGSNKEAFYISLLGYMIKYNYPLDVIKWSNNFLNDNLKKSAKTLSKFNL